MKRSKPDWQMSGKNNNKQLPTDTSHFQTIHHPVHITLEVAIEPAQITPQSNPYKSITLTITVINERRNRPPSLLYMTKNP